VKTNLIDTPNGKIAIIVADTPIITDAQSALDLAATLFYEHGCQNIAINKAAITEDFFRLPTGVAGEIAQKLVNSLFEILDYNVKRPLIIAGTRSAAAKNMGGLAEKPAVGGTERKCVPKSPSGKISPSPILASRMKSRRLPLSLCRSAYGKRTRRA
jgi:hypothetical protein